VRPPDLLASDWRCDFCGPVPPLHTTSHISAEILKSVRDKVAADPDGVPLWCPWPLPTGWMVTGVAWAGDHRRGIEATAVAVSGPAPLSDGPADVLFVAEQPGVGLGNRLAGLPGTDPAPYLRDAWQTTAAHAKVRAAGHPTPLWAVSSLEDRSAYVGEAMGVWLYAVAWPSGAGYLLAEQVVLQDLTDSMPAELVYGAPSPYLHGGP
jgi:hypothetical protein